MAKNLPSSVDLGAGDSTGYNPINIGGNSGLPSSVSSPLAPSGGIGATKTDIGTPNKGDGGNVTLT
jgi:hypothetical protein